MALEALGEGTVTVLFTDIVGSTDLGARSGDHSARKILREHEDLIRAQVAEHGGREIKALGDGFMVAFSSARRGLACAVAIQRALEAKRRTSPDTVLPVRMGLNAGEAIHEGGDLFGAAVSAAARISDKASGGEILVSEVVKALVGPLPDVTLKDRGRVRLKGFEDKWRLFEVVWQREPLGSSSLDRTPFVGRQDERALLRGYLDRLADGRGGLVMIGGEPGVGKTRLAEEIAHEAVKRQFRTLTGRCYEMDSPPPYLPFVELLEGASKQVDRDTFRLALGDAAGEIAKVMPQLRQLYDDIPPPLDLPPEQERRYLFNSICEFVTRAASTRPLVVVLDDLQWADESSLLLLQHIAQALDEVPVLILGTYRDIELDIYRPLARALDNLVRRRLAERVGIRRFSHEGVGGMLTKLAGRRPPAELVDAIFKETEGNAFFVEEVFRHLSEEGRLFDASGQWRTDLTIDELEVPEGVRLVIGRRLERVAEATRKALTVAAVIGRSFPFQLLELVGEVQGDDLLDAMDEAEGSHLITLVSEGGEARFTFVHELIRQTLLSQIALPRRQRLHLRVAEAMEEFFAGRESERAVELAHHFYQAGAAADPAKTLRYLSLAGDNALTAAAFEDALNFYEEGLSLVPPTDERGRASMLFKVGSAQRSLGRLDDGLATWRDALETYEALGDRREVGVIAAESALQLGWAGRWHEAVDLAGRGLAALGSELSQERVRLLSLAGVALSWAGQHDAADQMIEDSLALANEIGDEGQIGGALVGKCIHVYAYFQLVESVELGERAAEILRRAGDVWTLVNALGFMALANVFLGRIEEAERVCDELEPLAARIGHAGGSLFALRARSICGYVRDPDLDALERFAHEDRELCEKNELPWIAQSYTFLGRTKFLKHEFDEAREQLERGVREDPPGALHGFALGVLAFFLAHTDREAASQLADEVVSELPRPGDVSTIGRWVLMLFAAEVFAMLGDVRRCKDVLPLVEEAIDRTAVRFDGRPTHAIAGVVAATTGDLELAERHFGEALALVDRYPNTPERGEVRRLLAEMLIERGAPGDVERARQLLQEALELYWGHDLPLYEGLARNALDKTSADAEVGRSR